MNETLAHRGPNDDGVFIDEFVGLGARRLSIFDLSTSGHQPMVSADGRYVLSYNGEIYNWPEIRNDLKFRDWRSQTDTETLLQAYAELGPACLELLNGMFGFAIWDRQEKSIFLARDRIGIKPFYYAEHDGRFLFASEAKALFAAGHPIQANQAAVYDFLRWGLIDNSEQTLYANVHELNPGHWMRVSADGQREIRKYWNLSEIAASTSPIPVGEASERYAEGLREAIRLYSRSDVPVAAFISGGVDASILISFMAEQKTPNLCSFTYDFDTGDTGERFAAKETADLVGVEHDHAILSHKEVPDYFEKVLYYQEFPITSMRVLAHFKLYELARKRGYTVILDGNGGDQTGGGFEYYWMSIIMDTMVREGFEKALDQFKLFMKEYNIPPEKQLERLLGTLSATLTPGVTTTDGTPFANPRFLGAEFRESFRERTPTYVRPFDSNLLNFQYIDLTVHNQRRVLRMSDRCSMGVSLEQRVPVLDHRLVELGFCSANDARVNGTEQRHYMREAASRLLPDSILRRPKRSIVDPQRKWLKEELRDWIGDLFHSKAFSETGIFDAAAVRTEYEKYCAHDGLPPSSYHIFQFVNIGQWYQRIVNGNMYAGLSGSG